MKFTRVPQMEQDSTLTEPLSYQESMDRQKETKGLPSAARMPMEPRKHKVAIAISFGILLTSNLVLPILLYYVLRYVAHTKPNIAYTVPIAIFGVMALYQLMFRMWSLVKASSNCRPAGTTRWSLDYFQWNFIFGFIYITVVIAVGSSLKNDETSLRVVCMSPSLLLLQVCGQQLVGAIFTIRRVRYPFRFSSMRKGEFFRPATFTIVEDICAVDFKQGTDRYREPFKLRYETSPEFRKMMLQMDFIWGICGISVAIATLVVDWVLTNANVAYTLGWSIPWAGIGTLIIVSYVVIQRMFKKEERYFASNRFFTGNGAHADV